MATHSSILAWRIPWKEEPGGLQSAGSQRVRHDLTDLAHIQRAIGRLLLLLRCESCLTLCNSMDCSPPGSSVHGILQARILEWVAFPFSRGSSQPRYRTQASPIASRFFTCLSYQGSYTSITSPIINIPHASFGVTDETTLTYYNHPKPIVYIMYSTKRERTAPRGKIGAVHSIQF